MPSASVCLSMIRVAKVCLCWLVVGTLFSCLLAMFLSQRDSYGSRPKICRWTYSDGSSTPSEFMSWSEFGSVFVSRTDRTVPDALGTVVAAPRWWREMRRSLQQPLPSSRYARYEIYAGWPCLQFGASGEIGHPQALRWQDLGGFRIGSAPIELVHRPASGPVWIVSVNGACGLVPMTPIWGGLLANSIAWAMLGALSFKGACLLTQKCKGVWNAPSGQNRCSECGYDLMGLPDKSGSCPECGRARPFPATMRKC